MQTVSAVLLLTGVMPLIVAARANQHTSLKHAVVWTWLAWLAWCAAAWSDVVMPESGGSLLPYLALCLTACAGIAVLGARWPGVAAWNFVVLGLLAVVLLPVLESIVVGRELKLEAPRALFLGGAMAVMILNYLPTRLAPAALLLGAGCLIEIMVLDGNQALVARQEKVLPLTRLLIALAPWAGMERMLRRPAAPDRWNSTQAFFDMLWLDFRDRYGLVWGQRVREQFNRSAHHAGWPVILRWGGLRWTSAAPLHDAVVRAEILDVLRALLKRFAADGHWQRVGGTPDRAE